MTTLGLFALMSFACIQARAYVFFLSSYSLYFGLQSRDIAAAVGRRTNGLERFVLASEAGDLTGGDRCLAETAHCPALHSHKLRVQSARLLLSAMGRRCLTHGQTRRAAVLDK